MWQFDSSQSHHLPVFNWVHVQPQTSDFYLYLLVILSIPGIPTMKHFISWSRHHILGLFMLLISHQHHQHHTKSQWNHIKDISDLPSSMDPFVFFSPSRVRGVDFMVAWDDSASDSPEYDTSAPGGFWSGTPWERDSLPRRKCWI
jgi:hypothetical protein